MTPFLNLVLSHSHATCVDGSLATLIGSAYDEETAEEDNSYREQCAWLNASVMEELIRAACLRR